MTDTDPNQETLEEWMANAIWDQYVDNGSSGTFSFSPFRDRV